MEDKRAFDILIALLINSRFNDKCKSLHRNFIKCLNVFNRIKCKENHVNLNNAKKKYKLLEAQLKRKYKRQGFAEIKP